MQSYIIKAGDLYPVQKRTGAPLTGTFARCAYWSFIGVNLATFATSFGVGRRVMATPELAHTSDKGICIAAVAPLNVSRIWEQSGNLDDTIYDPSPTSGIANLAKAVLPEDAAAMVGNVYTVVSAPGALIGQPLGMFASAVLPPPPPKPKPPEF